MAVKKASRKSAAKRSSKKIVKKTQSRNAPKTMMKKFAVKKATHKPAASHTPSIGSQAPDFTLQDMHGHYIQLSKLRGSTVVLYFYPKDDTPGCTIEAQEFTRQASAFGKRGVLVFGISADSIQSHCDFAEKHNLGITLLSDQSTKTIRAYGCWVEKVLYGKNVMGISRTTFIIDKQGKIKHIFHNVEPNGHAKEVLAKL